MAHVLLLLLGALVVGAVAYGVTWVITGHDRGLDPQEPDGRAVPLPATRPLTESDVEGLRFDITVRGYRMDQVDAALRRAAYDLGYKEELIEVLEAEIAAIREGRSEEAESLRTAREGSRATGRPAVVPETAAGTDEVDGDGDGDATVAAAAPADDESVDLADHETTASASSGR
jgi:DivIVA domain-containing protein